MPMVTFAFKLPQKELDAFKRGAGDGQAGRVLRELAAAFTKGDGKTFSAIVAHAKATQ